MPSRPQKKVGIVYQDVEPVIVTVQVIEYALLKLENADKIPNLHIRGHICKINLLSKTAFRGFGFPQGAFVTETWMIAMTAKSHLLPDKNIRTDIIVDGSFHINPVVDIGQGLGEAGMFLSSSVFFAMADAVAAAREERGLPPV
ncbi:Aldehyde oxidase 3 [Lemmus lemmus]